MNEFAVRENLRGSKKEFNKTEDDLKSLQSVGQIIGEVLRPLDNERCKFSFVLCFTPVLGLKLLLEEERVPFFLYHY